MADLKIALELSGSAGNTVGVVDSVTRALRGLDDQATQSGRATTGLFDSIKQGLGLGLGVNAISLLIEGLRNLSSASIGAATDFEHTMSGVKAVSGATAEQMRQLQGLALQLGKDTSFSAKQAAAGLEELVKGGISISDIMHGAAQATLNLAAAGGVNLTDAATLAANAMNQFNLKGTDMAHVADLIAGAANASAIDVDDFRLALQQSGAVASTTGFKFDDLAQAIAIMGQAGIRGSDAGTSLKTMMMNLQPETNKQKDLMRELGLTTADGANKFFDAAGKVKSMADVAQILQDATKNLTEEQRLQALQTIFGSDAIRAAAVLAKSGAAGFREMAAAMGKVTAESVATERLNNLSGALEQLRGSLETAAISTMEKFTPGLAQLALTATHLVNDAITPLETAAGNLAARLTAGGQQIQRVVQQWGPLFMRTFQTIGAQFALFERRMGSLFAPLTQGASSGLGALVQQFTDLPQTILKGLLGLPALTAQIFTAVDRFWVEHGRTVYQVVGTVQDAARAWTTALGTILQWAQAQWPKVQAAFTVGAQAIQAAWATMGTGLQLVLRTWSGVSDQLARAGLSLLQGRFEQAGKELTAAWQGAWQIIQFVVANAWEAIQAAVDRAAPGLLSKIGDTFDGIGATVRTAMDAVGDAANRFGTWMRGMADAGDVLGRALGEVGRQLESAFGPILTTVAAQFAQTFGDPRQGAQTLLAQLQGFVAGIPGALANLPQTLQTAFAAIPTVTAGALNVAIQAWNAHVGTINTVLATIQTAVGTAITWVSDNWPTIQETVGTVFSAVQGFVTGTLLPALGTALGKLGEVKDWVLDHWGDISTAVGTVFGAIQGFVTGILAPALGEVMTFFGRVWTTAQEKWPEIQRQVATVFEFLRDRWHDTLQPSLEAVMTFFGSVWGKANEVWPQVQTVVAGVFGFLRDRWNDTLSPALETVKTTFGQVWERANEFWPQVQTKVAEVFGFLRDRWNDTLEPALRFLQNKFVDIWNEVQQRWPDVQTKFGEVAAGIKAFWDTTLEPALRGLQNKFIDIVNVVQQSWPGVQTTLTTAFREVQRELSPTSVTSGNLRDTWRILSTEVGPRLGEMLRGFLGDLGLLRGGMSGSADESGRLAGGLQGITGALRDLVAWVPRALDFFSLFGQVLTEVQKVINGFGLSINKTVRGDFTGAMQAVEQYAGAIQRIAGLIQQAGQLASTPIGGGGPINQGGGGINFGGNGGGGGGVPTFGGGGQGGGQQGGGGGGNPVGNTGFDFRSIARAAATSHGVDPSIFERQINQESGFAPDVISGARLSSSGARGIAQFMPDTAAGVSRQMGVPLDRFWADPVLQLEGAAMHMRDLLDMFGGNMTHALAGYNAGPGNVQRWLRQGGRLDQLADLGLGETREYIRAIQGLANGGLITEPVMGVGLHTGQGYALGERGTERVLSAAQTADYDRGAGRSKDIAIDYDKLAGAIAKAVRSLAPSITIQTTEVDLDPERLWTIWGHAARTHGFA